MNTQRVLGIVLFVAGVALLIVGLNASHSVADRWSNFFTGHFTDATVWYIVGGVAIGLVGLSMAAFNGGTNTAK